MWAIDIHPLRCTYFHLLKFFKNHLQNLILYALSQHKITKANSLDVDQLNYEYFNKFDHL